MGAVLTIFGELGEGCKQWRAFLLSKIMNYKHSTFQSPIHRGMKQLGIKHRSENSYNNFVLMVMEKSRSILNVANFHLLSAESYASYLWKYKPCHHYFLDDGIADFCVGAVKELSEKFYKPLPEPEAIIDKEIPDWIHASIGLNNDHSLMSGIAIHFPSNERQRSVMLVQNACFRYSEKFGYDEKSGEKHLCSIVDGEDILLPHGWAIHKANNFCDDKGQDWLARLIFGLGLYVDAFPDAICCTKAIGQVATTAAPTCWNVRKSEIMESENKNSMSPHYRKGHFRLLQSERYKNMKGQSVFVNGSFVKGQAFDVQ